MSLTCRQVGCLGPQDSPYPGPPLYGLKAAKPGQLTGTVAYEKPCTTVWLTPAA
ncbi:hypothetical protein SALBM311S_10720 [Streptomyces alboniger]